MVTWIARETTRPTIYAIRCLAVMLILLLLTPAAAQDIFQRASFGTPQTVRFNLLTSTVNATDQFGQTPLMYAASNNPDPEVITALVQVGADVNIRTLAGWTALMYAARDNSNPAVATRLLQLGADPTVINDEGFTAADYAAQNANLRGVPMTAPLEMPMPDPASISNPAAFVRANNMFNPNTVPFVAAPYQSPFEGVSPEFVVPGEFGAFVMPRSQPQMFQQSTFQQPTFQPQVSQPFQAPTAPTLIAPPTNATVPYYPPAVAATPNPFAPNPFAPNPFAPSTIMSPGRNAMPGFEGISPEFVVPGEFGMGFMPPGMGQINMQPGQTLPAPSFVSPQPTLRSPIALSNAPVTPGRFAPNVPTYAGGSAATIANRSAIGVGYERVPVRYSSSLLPDSARVSYGTVRFNPFLPLRDCSEFASQVSAQAFFVAAGGPSVDRHNLDPDGNGIACENLP